MTDLIRRSDAIGIIEAAISDEHISARASLYMARAELTALPSAEYEEADGVITIEKQSAKDVGDIKHIVIHSPNYTRYFYNESMPIPAEAEPTVIRCKTLLNAEDFEAVATRIRKENRNVIVIPCETEVASAEAVPQSEQYKKGFEDAKRAFLVEYAKESENMRKRNAQLEVMLNIQKELSARAEWIPCSERLPSEDGRYLVTYPLLRWQNNWINLMHYGKPSMPNCEVKGKCFYVSDDEWGDVVYDNIIAWMPLPEPY